MVDWIVEGLQWIWSWFLGLLAAAGDAAWDGFADSIPGLSGDLQGFAGILLVANQWVPLDVLIAGIGLHWAFVTAFVGFKMVLKFIPTIG